jgi:CRISPR-associated protein Csd1
MILQSLYSLYERLRDDPAYEIAPPGYSLQKISFKVVLRHDGTLFEIQSTRQDGRPRQLRVLGETKSSGSGLNPRFLWDNTGYMLGFKTGDLKPNRTRSAFDAFRKLHLEAEKDIDSPAFSAVCSFLKSWSPERAAEYPLLSELSTGFGVFQIEGETSYVHQDSTIDSWWQKTTASREEKGQTGQCLLTGESGFIARLQPMIKGVMGGKAQSSLVGFNDPAYESYGKEQAYNAPVAKEAAFGYGAALNALMDGPMRSKHRFTLGDATIAFWTDRPSLAEDIFVEFAQHGTVSPAPAQDEALRKKLEVFLRALRQGVEAYSDVDQDPDHTNYYMLSLSPNAARLSVRFFNRGTVRELLENLRRHYRDMSIERQFGEGAKRPDPEFPPAWMLLQQTARNADDIPPVLSGPLLRAILTGARYPAGLYTAVIRRIRADRQVNYLRACVIKGWLVRNQNQEVSMSLDTERKDPAYRVGRLFAALEKTQVDALGEINATIRDRFYSAASATPQSVFPLLLRTYQHHLAKLEAGLKVNREKLVQEIVGALVDFPAHLNLSEQGLFALGYYHQMQRFFRRKIDAAEVNPQTKETMNGEEES